MAWSGGFSRFELAVCFHGRLEGRLTSTAQGLLQTAKPQMPKPG